MPWTLLRGAGNTTARRWEQDGKDPHVISRRLALGAGGLALLLGACQSAAPPRALPEDGTIDLLTLLRGQPEHSRFMNALAISGQASRIGRQNGAVTLFVPTNAALDSLPADLRALLDSPPSSPTPEQRARAAALVNANAAWNMLRTPDIQARNGRINTWDRGRLTVTPTGPRSATVAREGGRSVTITRADVLASDGVFHVTSGFIQPGA